MAEPLASPAQSTPVAARKRSPWKLGLLVVLLIGMAFLAWFLPIHIRHRRQWEAIAVIERLGGGVEGHWNGPKWLCRLLPDDDWAVDADPLGPNWMRSMLPGRFVLDYFLIVDRVSVDNGLGLHSATNLSGQSRNIYPVQMTDAELAYVARFPQLQHLYLRRTQVGDAGIKHLHKLRHLKQLFLSFTLITDESTETLAQLENLEVLRLVGTQITDEGLFNLKSLKHLQQLDIRDTEVTADGIRAFQANSMLRLNWASAMHSRNSPADD